MTTHFPAPLPTSTAAEASGKRPRQGDVDRFFKAPNAFCTLGEFLEDLMNTSMAQPHDPYVVVNEQKHW